MTSNFRLNTALGQNDSSRVDSNLGKLTRTHEGNMFKSLDNTSRMKMLDATATDGGLSLHPLSRQSTQLQEAFLQAK